MATNEVGSSPEEQEDENPSEADSSSSPVRIKPAGPKSGFFTIYKSGQGYWTRMGTAAAALLLAVLTVGFLYQQLPVPLTPAFTPSNLDTISNHVDGPTLSPADNAARLAQGVAQFAARQFADSVATLRTVNGDQLPADSQKKLTDTLTQAANAVRGAAVTHATIMARDTTMGICAAFLIGFALLVFFLMNKPTNADFMIATDSEMKKVNWTSRKELIGSTKVVIAFMFLIAFLLFGLDVVFGYFFKLITVLKAGPFG